MRLVRSFGSFKNLKTLPVSQKFIAHNLAVVPLGISFNYFYEMDAMGY